MRQEDYNDMMRTPEEVYAERNKPPVKLPNCPYCGEEYSGDGVTPCVLCEQDIKQREQAK